MMDIAALLLSCAPLVAPSTAQALVKTESAGNPYAIGVVAGTLVRQPQSKAEALATVQALEFSGWNYSLGLAQINKKNFSRLGLTAERAFDVCANLTAMQTILSECFERARKSAAPQRAVRDALSCYYSGNFVTGYQHGYVDKVVAASAAIAPNGGSSPFVETRTTRRTGVFP